MQDKKWQVADTIEYGLLKDNARYNRNNMTEAESVFWLYAKSSGLGEKCRRQYIIGSYIADFFFRNSNLIVEIDGGYHFSEDQRNADAVRQDWLEHMGYQVIRFTNEEILFDTCKCIEIIKQNLSSHIHL